MSWAPSVESSAPSSDRGSFQGRGDGQGRRDEQHKVYVQNIPMDMQQESVESEFSKCGQVMSCKLLEPKGGRNTVVGFITFSTEDAVEEAIQKMTGCCLGDGPPLRVMRPASKSGSNDQSGGGKTCFKCGEAGHFSRECPNNTEQSNDRFTNNGPQFNNRSGGDKTCFKCGEAGHFSRECPNNPEQSNDRFNNNGPQFNNRAGGDKTCFKCGQAGHFSRECPNNQEQRGDKTCFKCGEAGHFSRECPNNQEQSNNNRNDNAPQFNNRDNNGPSFNNERSPRSNNINYDTNPGINSTQPNSSVNFMAMIGRGETRNTTIPPRPGPNAYSQPEQRNVPQNSMQNGYQEQPGSHNYQNQPYVQENKPPLEHQQPGNQQHNYNQPMTQGYQEQPTQMNQGYQQPQGNYQGQSPNQGYHGQSNPGSYQQPQGNTSAPGSYQEQQPNQGYQQVQQPSQDYQYKQQPSVPQGYQANNYQEPQAPPQPAHHNQQEQAPPQPSYNEQPPIQSYQPQERSQGYQPTSTPPSSSWGDSLAKTNGAVTMQEQSSWQPSGRSSNDRQSGGGDRVCHNCKEPGHFQRECPNPRQAGQQTCHKCGESGHFARECPSNKDSRSCHKCGEEGHFARECPTGNTSGPGGDQLCHRCGGAGHFARDCSQSSGTRSGPTCHRCGKEGHISRECPESPSKGGSGCHRCGEEGHFARECPNMPEDSSRPAPVTYIPEESDDMESLFRDVPHTGINFERYDQIAVKVSGLNDPPPPVNTFEEVNLGPQFKANIRRAGFTKPTPVQKYTFPIVLNGGDLMACAQTGSGKTVAYLLPTLTNIINRGLPGASRSPLVLCLAPTRELVRQIYQETRKFSDGTPIRVCEVYGGVSVAYQAQQLEQGCHFLAATPGRLMDFISRERIYLDNIQYLIIDEADRMLDMGFEQDIRKIVEQSNMTDKLKRQTLMFSATFPDEIQRLAGDFLKTDYLFLAVGRVGGTNLDIEQTMVQADGNDKRDKLFDILNASGKDRTLVFVELKRVADFLACLLSENNFPTTSISSDRSQREREEALRDFRNGRANVLVATSVAARGLDIPDVKHVVNYDLPQDIDEYVHRIGRTGRIGNQGKATSFFEQGRDEKIARSLVKVLSEANQDVPSWLEQAAEDAVGSSYGPKGGRFSSRDHRERGGGRGRQNDYQGSSGVNLNNDPSSQFGSQAPGPSYNAGGGGSGPSYNAGGGGSGPSYNAGGGGSGPSYNAAGGGSGPSYKTGPSGGVTGPSRGGTGPSGGGTGATYNIGGGATGNSDDDWD